MISDSWTRENISYEDFFSFEVANNVIYGFNTLTRRFFYVLF